MWSRLAGLIALSPITAIVSKADVQYAILTFNEAREASCVVARSCKDWQEKGAKSGVYTIELDGYYYKGALTVWCDMDTAGGGWTVFQRRRDFTVDFNRSRTEYINGFGDISGDFWLGLGAIDDLSVRGGLTNLRVDLVAESGRRYWAQYTDFFLCFEELFGLNDRLYYYSGDAGDGLIGDKQLFYTYDGHKKSCETSIKGGWWYNQSDCSSKANLNSPDRRFMTWANIGRVTFSEMKIKPRD
ncbi:ficolin-1-A-like [Pomacea canaliculata]|uniref:ficolin-1-A-like n=1 Tax=Pomacea canaliculata TaxID=400727 RepID=UPI000D737AA1|nr:ficolin-1-A-like [Pomacea canaliculata]